MQIIDITHELTEGIKTYQSDPRVTMENVASIDSDGYSVTRLSMGSHSGTHVDAQSHYCENGQTAAEIPLNVLVGRCYVVDVEDFRVPANAKRVLVKGVGDGDSTLNMRQAEALLNSGVRVIGTDGMSIGNDDVHRRLLEQQCVVLEMLDLSRAAVGMYTLCALPLKIATDGAPMRACLIETAGSRSATEAVRNGG